MEPLMIRFRCYFLHYGPQSRAVQISGGRMSKLMAVAVLITACTTADAAITLFFDGAVSGKYQYHIEQTVGDIILPEDFFILYDFGPNSLHKWGWSSANWL